MEPTDEKPADASVLTESGAAHGSENNVSAPAQNAAADVSTQPAVSPSEINANQSPATPQPAPVPETAPSTKSVRLADSPLETEVADLPPLSTLPSTSASAGNGDPQPADARKTITRRGLGRGGSAGNGVTAAPDIGLVDDPKEINETLSGKFVNGYSGHPDRTSGSEAVSIAPPAGETGGSGAPEFTPPVSNTPHKAELDPERERSRREERRPRHGRDERDSRSRRDSRREPFFGERREDQPSEWTPGERSDRGRHGANSAGNAKTPAQPRKFHVDPPEIPVQEEESLWTRIKDFFANLFGKKDAEEPAGTDRKPSAHREGRGGDRQNNAGRGGRNRRNGRNRRGGAGGNRGGGGGGNGSRFSGRS